MPPRIEFALLQASGGDQATRVMPLIDGEPLDELVARFERGRFQDVAGEYGGIVPAWFDYGDLAKYFLGAPESPYWQAIGKVALLGCECGEVGCWPFYAKVEATADAVTWSHFEQPHRPARDYGGLGPLIFAKSEYEDALRAMVAGLLQA
jgi:hypothetical protein